ncbi:MAG TPA: MBL fold metallo-hydrolase [Rhabdochlamydiaceae bacterium]|jgi:7,8-dihydropterin-6-yl-methyl-4-(beta-D-ribofuranosyl)aminobenzene 5'-phosphate synthase
MSIKISILYDNRSHDPHLQEGWGFSALIESDGYKILFDTGGDAKAFAANAEKMQIPFSQITHLVFSHRHWDHIAGLLQVVEALNKDALLYIPRGFPWLLAKKAASRLKTTRVKDSMPIAPHVFSLVLRGGFWLYEQALLLQTPSGIGVLTGCAHPGIIAIIKQAQRYLQKPIAFVIGGFHLLYTSAEHSENIVKEFQELGVQKVAPCHCSGEHVIRKFEKAYGSNFLKVGTGAALTF